MSGKTFKLESYSDDATLDAIEDAIDALQDAAFGSWVEIELPDHAWINVERGAAFYVRCSWPSTGLNATETKLLARRARQSVTRLLHERLQGQARRDEIERALGGTCDVCKQLGSHTHTCPIGGRFGKI